MSERATAVPSELGQARERFLELVSEVRPELHRYCARLVGSVVDGEDVVQDALAKAFYAVSMADELPALRPWLFRIAHNTAIDFLRRYERRNVETRSDFEETAVDEVAMDPATLRASLASFLELPVAQRCAVILKDVLACSLEEVADTIGTTVAAAKSLLARGRAGLRAGRDRAAPTAIRPERDRREQQRLHSYVALFNARDWEALRALMAEEVRLDLVSRAARRGAAVGEYFERYRTEPALRLAAGTVEGRPAILVFASADAPVPAYFILLGWNGDRVAHIRDFRYAAYVARDAEIALD